MRKHFKAVIIGALLIAMPAFAQTTPERATPERATPERATPDTAKIEGAPSFPERTAAAVSQSASPKHETDPPTVARSEADKNWADILSAYLSSPAAGPALFDYAALAANVDDMTKLERYIQGLAAKTPSAMPNGEAMAYWANLYNALTVQIVAQNYPVKSIRDIKSGWRAGPWRRDLVTVEGRALSLDDIEHDIMRPTFKTPLIHYMVNCASIGCPDLKPTPWHAATLEQDLDMAARTYINSTRGVRVDKGQITASRIYKWFRKDFGTSEADVIAHVLTYADDDLKAAIANALIANTGKIDKYKYDWGVNAP